MLMRMFIGKGIVMGGEGCLDSIPKRQQHHDTLDNCATLDGWVDAMGSIHVADISKKFFVCQVRL